MKNYKALLFDLNGTMIDDMPYHIKAWYRILNELGAAISMEETKQQCYGKNHELLERIFPGRFSVEEKDKLSLEKEKQYQAEFRKHLKLIDGLEPFLNKAADEGKKMAIGSAAIRFNIDFVLDGLNIRHYFDTIVCADDVAISKPDPETWLQCASELGESPAECLVFEDTPKGVESASNAGMDSLVVTTLHKENEFNSYNNVVRFIADYHDDWLKKI